MNDKTLKIHGPLLWMDFPKGIATFEHVNPNKWIDIACAADDTIKKGVYNVELELNRFVITH